MRILLSGDGETIEEVCDAILKLGEDVNVVEKTGSTGEHIVEIAIQYGPPALEMIKTSLETYLLIKKIRRDAKLDVQVTDEQE